MANDAKNDTGLMNPADQKKHDAEMAKVRAEFEQAVGIKK
jgi:hypothetical protein